MNQHFATRFFNFLKVFLVLALVIPSMFYIDGGISHKVAKANTAAIDSQTGCYADESEDSDDSGDSKKDSDDSSDGADGSDVPNKENIKDIYEFLHGKYGFSGEFIAGILGNWKVESKIDPTANEPGNYGVESAKAATSGMNGIGYGQWTAGRHTALVNWAKKKDKDWWESDVQMDFMVNGDTGFKEKLRDLALNSGDDPVQETINFHSDWEISADTDDAVRKNRGGGAEAIWKYMKKEGMDGKKDESKIKKIGGSSSGDSDKGESTSSTDADEESVNYCGSTEKEDDSVDIGDGEMGASVKANGKSGKTIGKNYEWDELPSKYKKYVKLPRFDTKYLNKPGNVYPATGNKGQCTELTWAYMSQLWDGTQPIGNGTIDGNGNVVYKAYKKAGAKITENPTVGYGFSSDPPQAGAGDPTVGHTGVVVGVMPDGKWIMSNYNVPPKPAPSRTEYFTVVDGNDGGIKFFSGIGKPKIKSTDSKKDSKKKD